MDGLDLLYKHIVIRPILFDSSIKEIPKEAFAKRYAYTYYDIITIPILFGNRIVLSGHSIIHDYVLNRIIQYLPAEHYFIVSRYRGSGYDIISGYIPRVRYAYIAEDIIAIYNVVRKYIMHNVIYELIYAYRSPHAGKDIILYTPDIYRSALYGYIDIIYLYPKIRPKYQYFSAILDYSVIRKYIIHYAIHEVICRLHISHIGEDTILYIPDIYHTILRGYNIIKDNILRRIFPYTTHEYYGIIGRLKIQSEFPIIYEYVQIPHIPYKDHDIILYAPNIYKYANIDPIICGNIIIKKSELILSELNLIRNILFEPIIKCVQYIEVYEVFDFISAIDELQIAIREPKLIFIDDADKTLSRTYRIVYYPYALDIIQLLNTPYPLQLIIYHGLPPTIHDKYTLKYLKPSISIILNTSLQQYIKYPRIDILKMGVERINTLLGRRIITENDIIKAIQYTEKPLLQHVDGLYYWSEIPKTHILILRDKLVTDVKKAIPKLLKIIEDRYYMI